MNAAVAGPEPEPAREPARRGALLRRARGSTELLIGVGIVVLIVLAALLAPVLSPAAPNQQDLFHILAGFSAKHPLGTDELGRDELSRLLYAARTDLRVGVIAILFPFCFGTAVGTIAGFYGGIVDSIAMRIVDTVIAFPFYVLVIGLVFVVGPGVRGIYIAFAVADWVVYARAIRAATLVVRESDYVAAARGGGLGDLRILRRHVLPNTVAQAIVYAMNDIVLVIVAVVTLGYLGLGVQPPTADWGSMIGAGQDFLTTKWTLATIPGLAVVVTGLGLSLIGDGLAKVLRP